MPGNEKGKPGRKHNACARCGHADYTHDGFIGPCRKRRNTTRVCEEECNLGFIHRVSWPISESGCECEEYVKADAGKAPASL